MPKEISISVLDCNVFQLAETIDLLEQYRKYFSLSIHFDIIDSSFANNISFGPNYINDILNYIEENNYLIPCDIHFMIDDPESILGKINYDKIRNIYAHNKIMQLRNFKNESFPAIDYPDYKIPEDTDLNILLMTVKAGLGGQDFNEQNINISEYIDILRMKGWKNIGVDGGINLNNISAVQKADFIIIGSAFTKTINKIEWLENLLKKIK